MDDRKFDELLKSKIGEYRNPGFEPSALAALHQKMAAISQPWYGRYRTELIAGTATLLCAGMIFLGQYFSNRVNEQWMATNIQALKDQENQIQLLKEEIERLRNLAPDTIRITEFSGQDNSGYYLLLLSKISALERKLETLGNPENQMRNSQLIPLADYNAGKFSNSLIFDKNESMRIHSISRLNTRNPEVSRAEGKIEVSPKEKESVNLSAKTIRDIEKHYMRGVGIRVGPAVEIHRGFYSEGEGAYNFGGGIAADFIMSPSLSLETGVKYALHTNKVKNADSSNLNFPDVDPQLGQLNTAEIDFYSLELPLYLKYRYPFSDKTYLQTGVGYSFFIYTKEEFDYDYEISGNPGASINTLVKDKNFTIYPGTLNFSLGLSKELKNKKILETSLFYQHGVGSMGIEKIKLQFLGVKGSYWFKIR
ncbi:MAG TPA: hypothetical protein VGA21_07800 [Cyclobacteriaceae bacterium]|jgi:hypothetical protein